MEDILREINVLLVEDNVHDVFLVRSVFDDQGVHYTIQVLEDGKSAIDYVDRRGTVDSGPCPDLLLLDINLPKASGLEVLSHFRNQRECSSCRATDDRSRREIPSDLGKRTSS